MDRVCSRCGIKKAEKKFAIDKRRADGRTITCRDCYKNNQVGKGFKSPERRKHQREKLLGRKYSIAHRLAISQGQKRFVETGYHHFFKGKKNGKEDGRKNIEYSIWREKLLEKFGNKCENCDNKKDLHCHHIKCYYKHTELRYDVDNGKVLCRSCHMRYHGELNKLIKREENVCK